MSDFSKPRSASPYEILADYERRSLIHAVSGIERTDAPGVWRGIGFRLGGRYLASNLAEIAEVSNFPASTAIPGARAWLLGLANLRGSLLTLIDLNQFLTGAATRLGDSSRVLVVRQGDGSVGLLVDEVVGQRNFTEQQRVAWAATEPGDEFFDPYAVECYRQGDRSWIRFSMASLLRAPQFVQAAA